MTLIDGKPHQSLLVPADNKFHLGNRGDGKHYWLSPWESETFQALKEKYGPFDFDPCPFPLPEGFDGLTCEWGQRNYVNPPFGSIIHQGRKKGPTAWMRKAIEEQRKGKFSLVVYPVDKWVLMMLEACGCGAQVINLGDVRWLATEDGSQGKGTGRHIACFVLEPRPLISIECEPPSDEMISRVRLAVPQDQFTADEAIGDTRYTLTEAGYRAVMQRGAKLNGGVKAGEGE